MLGDRMALVALAFAVLEIGGSASEVGLVLAAGAFPLVATVLVGGVVADRASRRAVMVAADLVRVASQGAMAALLIAGVAEVWMLALVAGVTGAATGFFSPASTGLLPEVILADGLFALPLAFLAAAPSVALIACGALLSGAGMALAISLWESTLQRHVPGESLSRVSSYDWFGSLAFYPLGLAIWGPVAAVIGVSVSLWLAFGLAIVGTLMLISVPDIRHLPAAPPPAPAAAGPAGSPTT